MTPLETFKVIGSFVAVFGLLGLLSYYLIKFRKLGSSGKGRVKVLDRLILSKDGAVVCVCIYGKVYILGVTPNGITKLDERGDFPSTNSDLEEWFENEINSEKTTSENSENQPENTNLINLPTNENKINEFPTFLDFVKNTINAKKKK